MEDDPEFLELSERQRRAVDHAFDRGVRIAHGRPRKKRRLNKDTPATTTTGSTPALRSRALSPSDAGGFFPDDDDDAGGFFPDDSAGGLMPDDGGGGFIPEDDDGAGGFVADGDAGGFVPDDNDAGGFVADSTRATTPNDFEEAARIPLRVIPSLLSTLGLPSDEDVLAVFRASAGGWGEGEDGSEEAGGVVRKDFRAVCAALMGPDEGVGDGGDEQMDDAEAGLSSGSEDEFEPSDDDDEDGDDGDGEYGAPSKATTRRTRRGAELEEKTAPKLSTRQRDLARELWTMLKPDPKRGAILSHDEVKRWARELGEMWSDAEIADMVVLFSGQHEGRGLSFEDFSVVMLRAGLV